VRKLLANKFYGKRKPVLKKEHFAYLDYHLSENRKGIHA
jgi:hypothetical protein